jgi:hypothetical protein
MKIPSVLFFYGVKLARMILDNILYDIDDSDIPQ